VGQVVDPPPGRLGKPPQADSLPHIKR